MKLLILTQKVDKNDPVLGFFHRWIEEFAKNFEKVTVICLEKGEHSLPESIRVLSLGKEKLKIDNSKLKIKFRIILNFYSYIWQERKNYDAVFVHMNPEYIVLGGLLWRMLRKKISLWYVHRQANFKLWLAEKFAHVVLTSASESFQLKSKKVKYVGHGIDASRFQFSAKNWNDLVSLAHVGRVTRIKNIDVIIRAAKGWPLSLVGEPITSDDKKYQEELKELALSLGADVDWAGAVPNSFIPAIYSKATFSVNAAPDGGMDKSVLESWALGCPAFASNRAFASVFGEYAGLFLFKHKDADDLFQKIENFQRLKNKEEIVSKLSGKVRSEYDVTSIVDKISNILNA